MPKRNMGPPHWLATAASVVLAGALVSAGAVKAVELRETTVDYVFASDDRSLAPPNLPWWYHAGCDSISVLDGKSGAEIFRPIGRISPGQLATSNDGSITIGLSSNGGSFLQLIVHSAQEPNWSSTTVDEPAKGRVAQWQVGGPVVITTNDADALVSTRTGFEEFDVSMLRRGVLGPRKRVLDLGSSIEPADFELSPNGETLYIAAADGYVHIVDINTLKEDGVPIAYTPTHDDRLYRVRRTYASLSPDGRYLVINAGSAGGGAINVVDLRSRVNKLVRILELNETWDVKFNWAAGMSDFLAINGKTSLVVTLFKGQDAPTVLASAPLPPLLNGAYPNHPDQAVFWRPGAVAWSIDGHKIFTSRGGRATGKEWRVFGWRSDPPQLEEQFDFDSCTWTGIKPSPRDVPEDYFASVMPLDIITLNGRNRPTPTPSPTPSTTPTAPPSATPTAVAPPTPTPTPRPSATAPPTQPATPTRAPVPIYLPIALREHCAPGVAPVDAVLVVDASLSMSGAKLAAAKAAAVAFIDALSPANDRVALVAFNEAAALLQPLAGDPTALRGAVAAIAAAPGTRIDRGLDVALGELRAARRPAPAVAVVVLLTDGIQTVDADRPALLADGARAEGIDVWVVGLGGDVDAAYLRRVAGDADHADRYVAAASADDLVAVYRDIARLVPCPGERFWGRR